MFVVFSLQGPVFVSISLSSKQPCVPCIRQPLRPRGQSRGYLQLRAQLGQRLVNGEGLWGKKGQHTVKRTRPETQPLPTT